MYQCRCKAKNSWWWAESLRETCRVVIPINLEFSASIGFIHKELYRPYRIFFSTMIFPTLKLLRAPLNCVLRTTGMSRNSIRRTKFSVHPRKVWRIVLDMELGQTDRNHMGCIYFDFANTHTKILVRNYESAMKKFTADYIIRALILPGTYYVSTKNSFNNQNTQYVPGIFLGWGKAAGEWRWG